MKTITGVVVAVGVMATLPGAAAAQTGSPDSVRSPATVMSHANDPTLSSAVGVPTPTLLLTGTSKDQKATARIGLQSGNFLIDARLTGPLNDDTREARPASLNGLANAATLSGGITYMVTFTGRADPRRLEPVCSGARARGILAASAECTRLTLPSGEWRRRFDAVVDYGTAVFLSLQGNFAPQSFSWTDPTTLAKSTERHASRSFYGSLALYRDGLGFVRVSAAYEAAFSAGSAVQLCRPLGTTGALTCASERLQAPNRQSNTLVQFEYRRLFGDAFGIRPTLTYRTDDKTAGLEVPLYFLRGATGLTGGVSLGWRTDDKEVTVAVFVGDVLSLVKTN